MSGETFKECPCCNHGWKTRDDFVSDPATELIGYQASFDSLLLGLLLFNHACGTTVALHVDKFRDLYGGKIYETRKTGSDECPGYCLHKEELRACPAHCECAWVRELIQIIKKAKKARSK